MSFFTRRENLEAIAQNVKLATWRLCFAAIPEIALRSHVHEFGFALGLDRRVLRQALSEVS